MPRLEDLTLERFAAADHIAHPLVGLARNPHRDELARPREPRQVGRVALVVLAMHAGPLRDQRGRDHVARVAPLRERPMEHIARAARFIARVNLAVARDPGDPLLEFGEVVRQSLKARRGFGRCRQDRNRDRVLVHIHAEIDHRASSSRNRGRSST